MGINERFEKIIKDLYGNNKRAFANAVGISPTVVENVVGTRRGKPSYEVLEKILSNANINPTWLLKGEGVMVKLDTGSSTPSESESETVTVSREAWDIIKRQAESLERKDAQISDLISILKKINVQQDAPAACADAN